MAQSFQKDPLYEHHHHTQTTLTRLQLQAHELEHAKKQLNETLLNQKTELNQLHEQWIKAKDFCQHHQRIIANAQNEVKHATHALNRFAAHSEILATSTFESFLDGFNPNTIIGRIVAYFNPEYTRDSKADSLDKILEQIDQRMTQKHAQLPALETQMDEKKFEYRHQYDLAQLTQDPFALKTAKTIKMEFDALSQEYSLLKTQIEDAKTFQTKIQAVIDAQKKVCEFQDQQDIRFERVDELSSRKEALEHIIDQHTQTLSLLISDHFKIQEAIHRAEITLAEQTRLLQFKEVSDPQISKPPVLMAHDILSDRVDSVLDLFDHEPNPKLDIESSVGSDMPQQTKLDSSLAPRLNALDSPENAFSQAQQDKALARLNYDRVLNTLPIPLRERLYLEHIDTAELQTTISHEQEGRQKKVDDLNAHMTEQKNKYSAQLEAIQTLEAQIREAQSAQHNAQEELSGLSEQWKQTFLPYLMGWFEPEGFEKTKAQLKACTHRLEVLNSQLTDRHSDIAALKRELDAHSVHLDAIHEQIRSLEELSEHAQHYQSALEIYEGLAQTLGSQALVETSVISDTAIARETTLQEDIHPLEVSPCADPLSVEDAQHAVLTAHTQLEQSLTDFILAKNAFIHEHQSLVGTLFGWIDPAQWVQSLANTLGTPNFLHTVQSAFTQGNQLIAHVNAKGDHTLISDLAPLSQALTQLHARQLAFEQAQQQQRESTQAHHSPLVIDNTMACVQQEVPGFQAHSEELPSPVMEFQMG